MKHVIMGNIPSDIKKTAFHCCKKEVKYDMWNARSVTYELWKKEQECEALYL